MSNEFTHKKPAHLSARLPWRHAPDGWGRLRTTAGSLAHETVDGVGGVVGAVGADRDGAEGARRPQAGRTSSTSTVPSAETDSVTVAVTSLTPWGAWPMAMPTPAQVSISVSLNPSPTATVRAWSMPSPVRISSRALALETPGAAMSSQAVQPIEYSTPCTPDSA